MEKKARLWKAIGGKKVECTACARRCRIPADSAGFCFIRQNIGGELRLANYGLLEALQIDPIEKKPFNHFYPGTRVLGVGTSSCNFGCTFCQNHNISKAHEIEGLEYTPDQVVELALAKGVKGIAYTYNEPAIFIEYALDVAKVAKKHGLYNVFVTNGYLTGEAVSEMRGLIDAAVVDFKGNGGQKFSNRFEAVVSNEPVKEALVAMREGGIHIEITDLVVPKVGDSEEECDSLTKWIAENLGADTPLHFTRFYPDYKMLDYKPTPFETLKRHYSVAKGNGLNYVYVGNVAGNPFESTFCGSCGKVAVKRDGYSIRQWNIGTDGKCQSCGVRIPIIGKRSEVFENPSVMSLY